MLNNKITGVMACDPCGIIGLKGDLPWHYPAEFEHFKKTVDKGVLVMGLKTFNSLPQNLLKTRKLIVFTKSKQFDDREAIFVSSLDEFRLLDIPQQSELYMIGGAEVAHLFLENNMISEFILTIIRKNYDGDTKLNLDFMQNWKKEVISSCKDYTVYRLNLL